MKSALLFNGVAICTFFRLKKNWNDLNLDCLFLFLRTSKPFGGLVNL